MTDRQKATEQVVAISKGLDLGPKGPAKRAALTTSGAVEVEVLDRFTEIILNRHRKAVCHCLLSGDDDDLREFEGIQVDGLALVASQEEFFRAWLGWS